MYSLRPSTGYSTHSTHTAPSTVVHVVAPLCRLLALDDQLARRGWHGWPGTRLRPLEHKVRPKLMAAVSDCVGASGTYFHHTIVCTDCDELPR